MIVRVESKLVAASFWSLDNDLKQSFVFTIERLETGRISQPVFLAHFTSIERSRIDAENAVGVCSCLANIFSALFLIEAKDRPRISMGSDKSVRCSLF
jgi:hypothetical protein